MKKLTLLFASLVVLITINVNAQIVYTDIDPDGMPSGGGLDFNGDGTNEFNMSSAYYMEYTWSAGGNNIWANGQPVGQGSGWDEPKPLALNTVIDNSGNFIGCGDCAISGVSTNPFATMVNQNKYLGVRLKINGNTHYGWVQLVWDGNTFIYKDFAYESTPNKAIKAGQTVTSINRINANNEISIYPNPAKDKIIINYVPESSVAKIRIVDLLGKEVKLLNISEINNGVVDISSLKNGIYLISILEKNKTISMKKVLIER